MVSGESHYFEGNRYLLKIKEKNQVPSVSISNMKYLILQIRPDTGRDKREEILNNWYRKKLRLRLEKIIPKLEEKLELALIIMELNV